MKTEGEVKMKIEVKAYFQVIMVGVLNEQLWRGHGGNESQGVSDVNGLGSEVGGW